MMVSSFKFQVSKNKSAEFFAKLENKIYNYLLKIKPYKSINIRLTIRYKKIK
jgi:hypothetical protein